MHGALARRPSSGVTRDVTLPRPEMPEEWVDEGDVRAAAEEAVDRGSAKKPAKQASLGADGKLAAQIADDVKAELERNVGKDRAPKLEARLAEAAKDFERARYADARRLLKPLAEAAPSAPAVRQLLGLTLYQLGKWREAATELEVFVAQTHSSESHPVLADCYRALGQWGRVESLWEDLRADSPSAELVAEGRIVYAGALADQGDLQRAIDTLTASPVPKGKTDPHHLRVWYALADLYDRAGDAPRARELFAKVVKGDADFADAAERLASLG